MEMREEIDNKFKDILKEFRINKKHPQLQT